MKQSLASFYCFVLLATTLLIGCKADEVVVTRTEVQHVTDTLHHTTLLRDSIFLHDSIYLLRETLPSNLPAGRDTVRETKYVYRYQYRDRQAKDSVRIIHDTDTIFIQEPDLHAIELAEARSTKAEAKFRLWRLYFWLLLGSVFATAGFIVYKKLKS
ncbi:MAG: hypothetical protein IKO20_05160 [Bacteroidaceae bacterium]|nr:hypothetical protein [Bacteroidaceae bacterium]